MIIALGRTITSAHLVSTVSTKDKKHRWTSRTRLDLFSYPDIYTLCALVAAVPLETSEACEEVIVTSVARD